MRVEYDSGTWTLAKPSTRTVLLYLMPAFALLLVLAILVFPEFWVILPVAGIFLVCLCLFGQSVKHYRLAGGSVTFVVKSVKIHLLCLFLTTFFASPFTGMILLNTDYFWASVVLFAYPAFCIAAGVPTAFIADNIYNKREKAKEMAKILAEKAGEIEPYDVKVHGEIMELKEAKPKVFAGLGFGFLPFGLLMYAMGLLTIFQQDVALGIIVMAIFGTGCTVLGIVFCKIYWTSRRREVVFNRQVASIHGGEKAFVTLGKVLETRRQTIAVHTLNKYTYTTGFEFDYAFLDRDGTLRRTKGYIREDTYQARYSTFGAPKPKKENQQKTTPISGTANFQISETTSETTSGTTSETISGTTTTSISGSATTSISETATTPISGSATTSISGTTTTQTGNEMIVDPKTGMIITRSQAKAMEQAAKAPPPPQMNQDPSHVKVVFTSNFSAVLSPCQDESTPTKPRK